MKDVLVYHNPDAMGYPASEVKEPVIVTNKRVGEDAKGDRIWLITGEGRPRRYFLRGWFTVSEVVSGEDDGFRTQVSGSKAHFFRPMREISDEVWLPDFRRSQGNFAFGYQVIGQPRFVRGLEKAAGIPPKAT
ncbi:MAG: hypothetical protein ABIY55_21515 [Kofleriaceae bacterium]